MSLRAKLGIIFVAGCIGSTGFGGVIGYHTRKAEEKPCTPIKQVAFKDMTKKQWLRWQHHREDQTKGWILK